MRTVGEILRKSRLDKKLTFEEIESKIRIRKKYLVALEENDWNRLPSLSYIKGFLKNYASYLGINPEDILAVFRRQYQYDEKEEVLPEGVSAPLNEPFLRLSPQTLILILGGFFLLIFFINLGWQYKTIISPPTITVERPNEGEILKSNMLTVSGRTDADAVIEVNKKRIPLSENGEFKETFILQPGINKVIIESISKHGKKRTITRTVTVEEEKEE